ncbi:MAG: RRXRR domain-containing protein, partial [Thermaerobacter sp.]|nr:RRXRR domain-containing protein [Thermaerobacter sp.]
MGIAVISMHGKPLSPTTPAKARKLIQSGGAVPRRDTLGTFYIQLTTPTGEIIPHDTVVGIDPGKRYSGVGVQTPQATLWIGHLVLPFPVVKKAMGSRRQSRRFRRYRKTRQRSIRFRHRAGHKMPPSIKANRELEWRVLHELAKIYPITHVVYEVVKARGTQSFSP